MDGQDKSGNLLPVSSLFFAFLALGLVLVTETPFKGARPDIGDSSQGMSEGVRARLWEDPFKAVARYRRNQNKDAMDPCASLQQLPEEIDVYAETPHSLAELLCQMVDIAQRKAGAGEPPRITVLAATVFGGPYEDAAERRMRSRYAVLSGLGVSGYVPQDAEHIGYLDFTTSCNRLLEAGQTGLSCELPGLVPYEWLVFDNGSDRMADNAASATRRAADAFLVLWLDDDKLVGQGNPLTILAKLYRNLEQSINKLDNDLELSFKLLGPAGSSNLKNIYRERREIGDIERQDTPLAGYMQRIRIYSSSATVDEKYLTKGRGGTADDPPGPALIRTISTDSKLAQALICELERRGVDPVCDPRDSVCQASMDGQCCLQDIEDTGRCSGRGKPPLETIGLVDNSRRGGKAHIVLISEWDTLYGRAQQRIFNGVVRDYLDAVDEAPSSDADEFLPWLHPFTYLRGLDGKIPGVKGEGGGGNDSKSSDRKSPADYGRDISRPVGQNRFDYLRRLADKITVLNRQLQSAGKGSIQAVGILGSDVYDKLLILQALRNRLPGIAFFATDLDAQLLHPAEREWARNLIVASGFGLELARELQGRIPPFRDNYQTSLFLATMLAAGRITDSGAGNDEQPLQGCLWPRLYEVGQRGAVDLSIWPGHAECCNLRLDNAEVVNTLYPRRPEMQNAGDPEQPQSRHEIDWIRGLLLVVVAAILIWMCWFEPPLRNAMVAVFVAVIVALSLYSWFIDDYLFSEGLAGEPFTFTDGVSLWPTEIIRLGSALLSLFFIVVVISRLRRNAWHISGKYELPGPVFWAPIKPGNSASARGTKSPAKSPRQGCCTLGQHLLLQTWGMVVNKNERTEFRTVWSEYLALGYSWSCLLRVAGSALGFFVFAMLFMKGLGMPHTPFRGQVSSTLDFYVIMMAVFAYLILVFQVFDTTRLARRFVYLLMNAKIDWPGKRFERTCRRFGLPPKVAAKYLRLDVIQKHMAAIDPLIFYPFAVMFVMILSRSRYFDDWNFTLPLVIVIGVSALFALSSAFLLRRAARQAKQTTLDDLHRMLMMARACEAGVCDERTRRHMQVKTAVFGEVPDAGSSVAAGGVDRDKDGYPAGTTHAPGDPEGKPEKISDRIEMLIARVNGLQSGPFAPLARHPIVSALAMPFGGVGGLYLIDYLTTMNW